MRAVFSWSYRALRPDAARMLRLLGLHPGPHLTVAAAASLGGLPVRTAGKLLDELVQANLVIEQVPGRFALHDLMREYAVELVSADEPEVDRERAVRRLLDHYLQNGYAAAAVIDPMLTGEGLGNALPEVVLEEMADHDAAMNWLTAEQEVLLSRPGLGGGRRVRPAGVATGVGPRPVLRPAGQLGAVPELHGGGAQGR